MNIGVAGHQDMPPEARDHVRRGMTDALTRTPGARDLTGISSLAAGADQLFAHIVLSVAGRLHVVLPCEGYESTFEAPADVEQLRYLLAHAHRIERLAFPAASEQAFLAAGRRVVDLSDMMIVAWDRQPAKGTGGTADVVAYAMGLGKTVHNVWPEGVTR